MCMCMSSSFSVQEAHSIMTFVLSKNGRHALLNVATQVHPFTILCSLQALSEKCPLPHAFNTSFIFHV